MDDLTVGARFYNNGGKAGVRDFLEGDLAEILVFDRALSDDERQKIERYLSEKHRETLLCLNSRLDCACLASS